MPKNFFKMRSEIWLYPGTAGWHFITLPKKQSTVIKKIFGSMSRGWGSLPVIASIRQTSWATSIFYDNKAGAYLLPLKAEIRKKENLSAGETVTFMIKLKI